MQTENEIQTGNLYTSEVGCLGLILSQAESFWGQQRFLTLLFKPGGFVFVTSGKAYLEERLLILTRNKP